MFVVLLFVEQNDSLRKRRSSSIFFYDIAKMLYYTCLPLQCGSKSAFKCGFIMSERDTAVARVRFSVLYSLCPSNTGRVGGRHQPATVRKYLDVRT